MPREREYDRTDVLQKATEVFWSRGFAAAPVAELVRATGLNTASMYKEFGGKEAFFCAVLEQAWRDDYQVILAPLRENAGLASIERYLGTIAAHAADPEFRGCLFLNNLAAADTTAPRILERVDRFCTDLRQLFVCNLATAQSRGEITADRDPGHLANFLLCFVQGIALFGRSALLRQDAGSVVAEALLLLRGSAATTGA